MDINMKKVWRRMVSWIAAASICMTSMGSVVTAQTLDTEVEPNLVYRVVVDNCEHGTVKLDKESSGYLAGEKVHVTLTPEDGYTFSGITVYTANGQNIETEEEKKVVSFSMPAENVCLSATFTKETEVAAEAVTNAVTESETAMEIEMKPESRAINEKTATLETERVTENDTEPENKPVTDPETSPVMESETQAAIVTKDGQGYTKTFRVATTGGSLKILDTKGNALKILSEGETVTYEYPSPDSPAEVTIKAVAEEGYTVDSYMTKWTAGATEYTIPESLENINHKEYTRGHFLATADFDETFEASFVKNGSKKIKTFASAKIARDTGDIDNQKVGDTFTGLATVYYDGHPNIAYNGTGYIVCNDGAFKGDSITMSTCASGHDFAAPQTGQTGYYTITVTEVDTRNGLIAVSVYWENDSNTSGYQNLSGTYSYEQNFDGTLKVKKTTTDPEFTAYNYTSAFKKNMSLNATFGVYLDKDATQLVKKVKTDADGNIVKEGIDLEADTYFVQEMIPPKGFALNSTIKKVTLGAGSSRTVTIKDSVLRAKIIGKKVDALTGTSTPTSGLSLAGAVYGVFENSACTKKVTTGTTDMEGNIVFERPYFACGTYFIKELTPPPGYDLDGKVYKIVVDESLGFKDGSSYRLNDVTFTSTDAPLNGKAQVIKISSNKDISEGNKCYSLEGCKFKLTNIATKVEVPETLVTKSDGKTQVIDLPIGQYSAREIEAPKGFRLNPEPVLIKVEAGKTSVINFENEPANDPIGVLLKKIDAETGKEVATGKGELAGAEYTFKYYDGQYTSESQLSGVTPTRTWVLKTNDLGRINFASAEKVRGDDFYVNKVGMRVVPIGTISVQETKEPTGYELDSILYIQNITAEEITGNIIQSFQTVTSPEQIIRCGVQIEKHDVELNDKMPQGDAALAEASFDIYNRNINPVMVGGNLYQKDEVVYTLKTDVSGIAKTANDLLPYGDYEIIEKEAPKGYQNAGKIRQSFQIRENEKIVELTGDLAIKNKPIRGGVQIEKHDIELNDKVPQGNATLADAVFAIYNRSTNPVLVGGNLYQKDEVVYFLKTDVSGIGKTTNDLLPYGDYEIIEQEAPRGYQNAGKIQQDFQIRENGKIVKLSKGLAIKNEPIRGDLEGIKVSDGDLKRMSDVPFKITSETTQESHIVVTDENGMFSTASDRVPHSQNTNRGETAEDGVWFGDLSALDDMKGALLYDTYLVEELPCESNAENVLLKPFRVVVKKNRTVIKLGTITNDYKPKPVIGTTAIDAMTGGHEAYAGETTIIDKVEYTNLSVGLKYILKGILMDQATGKALLVNGKEVTAETAFIPEKATGTAEVKFTFDSSSLKGKSVVVFESLYQNGKEIAVHADIEDKGQTVPFIEPKISTTATDKSTGEHEANVSSKTTIIDVVKYENLIAGKEYNLKGILMNQGTGKALLADGKQVTSETTFIANNTNGTVEMKFIFDSSALQGTAVVVFEHLYYNKIEIATHADIEDKGQTVTFTEPKIGTKAADAVTGEQEAYVGETTIIDTVSYEGLLVGNIYTLRGILMDQATGKSLLVNGKEVTAETTFTAEKSNGTVEVRFTFDSSALKGKSVVVFEDLYSNGKQIATHSDINDKGQTVIFRTPEIGTKAFEKDTGKKVITDAKKVTIVDLISYKGLIAGKKYTVKGILMDKSTGEALKVKGKEVTAETTFTAEKVTGTVEVEFSFDATDLRDKSVVVFENLYYEGKEIATHSDIKDKAQTVKFVKTVKTTVTSKPTGTTKSGTVTAPVKTGDTTNILLWILLAVISLSSVGITGYLKFKKKKPV